MPKNNVAVKLQIKIEFMSSVVTKFEELGYPIGTEGNINVLDVEFNSTTLN